MILYSDEEEAFLMYIFVRKERRERFGTTRRRETRGERGEDERRAAAERIEMEEGRNSLKSHTP